MLQAEEKAAAETEATEASSKIPVPDKGFTFVLRAPMKEYPRLVKVYRVAGKNTEEVVPGFTVLLPEDTPIFFMVDEVEIDCYSVKITVEDEESKKAKEDKDTTGDSAGSIHLPTMDTKIRFLKDEIKYICVITPREDKEGDKEGDG